MIKSPTNKKNFKVHLVAQIKQCAGRFLEEGQNLFINGTNNSGQVIQLFFDSGYMRIAPLEDLTLRVDETDFKLFSFSKYLYQKGVKNILILSQDTDVKILAVYWSAVLENIKFIIKHTL